MERCQDLLLHEKSVIEHGHYVQCDSIWVKQPTTKSGQIPIKLTEVATGWN